MPVAPQRLNAKVWKRTRSEAWTSSSSEACPSTPASPASASIPLWAADCEGGGAEAAKLGDGGRRLVASVPSTPEAARVPTNAALLPESPPLAETCVEHRRRRGRRRRASKRRATRGWLEEAPSAFGEEPRPACEVPPPQLPIVGRSGGGAARKTTESSVDCCDVQSAPGAATCGEAVAEESVRRTALARSTTWAAGDKLAADRPAPLFDVVADEEGNPVLLPVDSPYDEAVLTPTTPMKDLPEEEVVTTRVFRFFEDHDDHEQRWEQQLRNVNTGSLLWLLVHLLPKMHTCKGAKYGKWFTVHAVKARAGSFRSGCYHAANESRTCAKTFGATPAVSALVTGQRLETGYFWYVHPAVRPESTLTDAESADVCDEEHLDRCGWQHVERAGPIHGDAFIEEWKRQGSPMDERSLQTVLDEVLLKAGCSLEASSPES